MKACIFLATVLLAAAAGAADDRPAPLKVETLGVAVRTMHLYRNTWVPLPGGKGWARLLFYHYYRFPIACQTVAINTVTGEATRFVLRDKAPRGAPWRWCIGHDGKCYMGHYGSASVWIYDPATNTLDFVKSDIRPVSTVCAIACGTDGKIYGSTTPKIITFQFDPATRRFTSYGVQGKKRDYLGYGYTVAADETHVYTAAGKIPWQCVAYEKKTGKQTVLFEGDQADYVYVRQQRYGVTAGHLIRRGPEAGTRKAYWLYRGKAIPMKKGDKPPWPVPAEPTRPAAPRPQEILDGAVPGSDGQAVYWWRTAAARAKAPKNPPPDATPEQLGWRSVRYRIEVAPVKIAFLHEMPDGRLIGCGTAYQDWFLVDPKTDGITPLGKIPLSHYATVFAGGKAYMTGYPSTPLYEYDPARPWTPGTGTPTKPAPRLESAASNPRRLTYFAPIIHTHHGRAAAVGADGRIYVGAHAERSHVGGGLGWWDPNPQKAGGLRAPFALHDVAGLCAVDGGRKVVYSSRLVTDPKTKKRDKAAKLFVFDVETQALSHDFAPFETCADTGRIVPGGGNAVVGVTGGPSPVLYRADVMERKVLKQVALAQRIGGDFRLGPDGKVWTFLGDVLVRIAPETLAIERLGTVERPGRLAFAGKDVYLAGAPELRVLRGVAR